MFDKLPSWVEWVCCNNRGQWFALKDEPTLGTEGWSWPRTGALMFDAPPPVDWRESKQRRCGFFKSYSIAQLIAMGCEYDALLQYMRGMGATQSDHYEMTDSMLARVIRECSVKTYTLDRLIQDGCSRDRVIKFMMYRLSAQPTDTHFRLNESQYADCLKQCCSKMLKFHWNRDAWSFIWRGTLMTHASAKSIKGFKCYVYEDGARTFSSWRSINGMMVLPIGFEYD